MINRTELARHLEGLYETCNRRDLIHPDPLEHVYRYPDTRDREIVGLISASVAYGRVKQILDSLATIFDILGPSPRSYILDTTEAQMHRNLKGFKHRWTTDSELVSLLVGIKRMVECHGSLEKGFAQYIQPDDTDVIPPLTLFVQELLGDTSVNSLLPRPDKGSACKRQQMFLRWMVRKDNVDPGCWSCLEPSKLIVPLDTHMFYVGRKLRMTKRKQADMKTAREITGAFKRMVPHDPVRYDFALTRLGIRADMSMPDFVKSLQKGARLPD
ncbi:MAG: TIGR02757 family protein [Candidatus Hydrogenedentota bacterium]|nr:MAG: TIGR02757 family protein [Candidatus Hydrogenedentota bacterium]